MYSQIKRQSTQRNGRIELVRTILYTDASQSHYKWDLRKHF
jgi:hypothetical protein